MNTRVWLLLGLVYLVLLVFVARLWQLQVVQYEQYSSSSKGNYLRTETPLAPRGRILDRNGVVLASNRLAVDLIYRGGEIRFKERILAITGLSQLPVVDKEPVDLMVNVPDLLIPTLAELTAGQDNLELQERIERVYPNPISGPVMGYTTLPSQIQVQRDGYEREELVGVSGLEAALETQLRGVKGVRLAEVNVRGQWVRFDQLREPQAGSDVYLTLDLKLQRAAERAIKEAAVDINKLRIKKGLAPVKEARGAIVALNPASGEIYAMATGPSFDPNLFGRRPRPVAEINALFTNTNRPTQNRAVSAYPPGSTYKLVSSSMFLESGYVSKDTHFNCGPYLSVGQIIFRNWFPGNMGMLNVEGAIAQSCNTWYYQAALIDPIGMVDKLHNRALELGVGKTTGLEIAEQEGLIPTLEWKRNNIKNEPTWYKGQSLNISIGQGYNLATPVQIARMISTIAESGRQPTMHMVRRIGQQNVEYPVVQVPGKHWKTLQDGMRKTVTWGTARPILGNFAVATAGKTGTAENETRNLATTHAWYMGYGPVTPGDPRPRLAVVAFFEQAGGGYDIALPAVKKVMTAFWGVGQEVAQR